MTNVVFTCSSVVRNPNISLLSLHVLMFPGYAVVVDVFSVAYLKASIPNFVDCSKYENASCMQEDDQTL